MKVASPTILGEDTYVCLSITIEMTDEELAFWKAHGWQGVFDIHSVYAYSFIRDPLVVWNAGYNRVWVKCEVFGHETDTDHIEWVAQNLHDRLEKAFEEWKREKSKSESESKQ